MLSKQQLIELAAPLFIQADDLTIKDSTVRPQFFGDRNVERGK